MITKTYRADSMIQALQTIKKEMGEEALVVSVRQVLPGSPWQVWRKPMVEVIAVQMEAGEEYDKNREKNLDLQSVEVERPAAELNRQSVYIQKYQGHQEKVVHEMPEVGVENPETTTSFQNGNGKSVQQRMFTPESNLRTVNHVQTQPVLPDPLKWGTLPDFGQAIELPPVLGKIYRHLVRQGLEEKLLQRICRICADSLNPKTLVDEKRVQECVQHQLEAVLRVQKEAMNLMPRVIFLVGSSGVGKTSFCAKMAVRFSIDLHQKVGWICADTIRIGALAEARTYSETIGIPLKLVYTPEDIPAAVEALRPEVDFILVDTPAFNPRSEGSVMELGSILAAFPRRSTWLVVPATAKEADLQNSLAAISPFKPRGLVVSKLDETNNFSAVFNLAWRSQLPLIYFSFGNRVLNEMTPARTDLLARSLFEEKFYL
jgi:flagellar biosynthesis protein FlhF